MSGQPDPPNWAEIASAIGTIAGVVVGIPAAALYLLDRRAAKLRTLTVQPADFDEAQNAGVFVVRFVPPDPLTRYQATIDLGLGTKRVLAMAEDIPGPLGHPLPPLDHTPSTGTRRITAQLYESGYDPQARKAKFYVIGPSLAAPFKVKITVRSWPDGVLEVKKTVALRAG
ncbi:hypothetical protein [Caulobacter sp. 602-1]|uniref:hypothetical protein n=1 Tax=Caulobacter sp. 602-1 TaxID=2492472 RepID=UPI000F631C8F|nr:hypothetical protein [Caulobacter sp. 602-1]RRN64667.1 hypothetical protein EIK80_11570 [Caulobacter sp. 602-1]